jgi:hypothetical protein
MDIRALSNRQHLPKRMRDKPGYVNLSTRPRYYQTNMSFPVPSQGADLTNASYTYILMSKTVWQAIPETTISTLEQRYNMTEDEQGWLVFLELK